MVDSPNWNNKNSANAGAVTWGSGVTGVSGAVNPSNSLVGTTAQDHVGFGGVCVLNNGNYVVRSVNWNNGAVAYAGAFTWGSGMTGVSGPLSAGNSLVGSRAYDTANAYAQALQNGNYVVISPDWNDGTAVNAGAVTWGSGNSGISGPISASNSLVGSTAGDQVGINNVTELANGDYVVDSPYWANGAVATAGAVTWGSGTTGVSGPISASNSLVGSTAGDYLGGNGVMALSNGNYVVITPSWTNGTAANAGAITWGSGVTGVSGTISASNSLLGSSANDLVGGGPGSSGVTALSNGNYVVSSPSWANGALANAGAATWGSGTTGVSGPISASNSLVGLTSNADLLPILQDNVNGAFYAPFITENNGKVRVGSLGPDSVVKQPANQTAYIGQNATFTAVSAYSGDSVQWFVSRDGIKYVPIAGATLATLTISDATAAMNHNLYEAVFTNNFGSVTTNAATLTVIPNPNLVNNPMRAYVGSPTIITGNLLKAYPIDAPNTVVYTLVSAPTSGTLQNGTTVLSAGSTFTQADIYAGKINFTGAGGGPASFQFTVTNGQGGSISAKFFNINVIPPTISTINLLEGTSGLTPFTFTIHLPASPAVPVTFDVYTADGTAKAGVQYIGITAGVVAPHSMGTVTFNPGQVVQTVTVYVIAGSLTPSDGTKSFTLHLSNPATPDDSLAVGTGHIIPQYSAPAIAGLNAYPGKRLDDPGMDISNAALDMVFAELSGDKKAN